MNEWHITELPDGTRRAKQTRDNAVLNAFSSTEKRRAAFTVYSSSGNTLLAHGEADTLEEAMLMAERRAV